MSTTTPSRRFFWVYQIAAVCLLLLVTSPFTAPFATCDLANGVLHTGLDESCDAVKDKVADEPVMPMFVDVFALVSDGPSRPVSHAAGRFVTGTGPLLFPLRL